MKQFGFSREYGPTKVLAELLDDDKREWDHRNFVEPMSAPG